MTNRTSQPSNTRTMLFCEPCGYKRIIETAADAAGLIEHKTSPVQARIPTLDVTANKTVNTWVADPKTGKIDPATGQIDPATIQIVNPQMKPQPKRYKCPKCGRVAKVRGLLKPFDDALKQVDERKAKERIEEEKRKRLEDGRPPEKKIDPDFIG